MLKFSFREGPTSTKIFTGFSSWNFVAQIQPNHQVVLVWTEDTYEAFLIEGTEGMNELKRFYRECLPDHEVSMFVLDQAP